MEMETPIVALGRLMWRGRKLLLAAFVVVLLHIWFNDALRAWRGQPIEYCDAAHKVRFIPADQCGGMTSCDRYNFRNLFGNGSYACPKE
jgi:hypothetical protein